MTFRPYRQGDLDYLCGVYSVVNAARRVLAPAIQLRGSEARLLFQHLLLALDGRLKRSVTDGQSEGDMVRLLNVASMWVAACYQRKVTLQRPFRQRSRVKSSELLSTLRQHLAGDRTAAIVGLCEHWSVVARLDRRHLILFDSWQLHKIPFAHCVIGDGSPFASELRFSIAMVWTASCAALCIASCQSISAAVPLASNGVGPVISRMRTQTTGMSNWFSSTNSSQVQGPTAFEISQTMYSTAEVGLSCRRGWRKYHARISVSRSMISRSALRAANSQERPAATPLVLVGQRGGSALRFAKSIKTYWAGINVVLARWRWRRGKDVRSRTTTSDERDGD
jgi:hypothetical protein